MRGQDPGSEQERVSDTPASPTPPKSFGVPSGWDAGQADTPSWGVSDPAPQSWQPPPAFTAAAAGMQVWRGPSGPAPAWPAATGEPIGEPWPGNSPAAPGPVVPGPATTAAAQEAAARENAAAPGTPPPPSAGTPPAGATPPSGIADEPRFFLPDPATGLPPVPGAPAASAEATPGGPPPQHPAWSPGGPQSYGPAPAGQDGAYPPAPGALPGPAPYAAVPPPAPGSLPGPTPYAVAPGGQNTGYPPAPGGALPGPMPYSAPTAQDGGAPAAPAEAASGGAATAAEAPAQGTGGAPAPAWAPAAPGTPPDPPGSAWAPAPTGTAEPKSGEAGDGPASSGTASPGTGSSGIGSSDTAASDAGSSGATPAEAAPADGPPSGTDPTGGADPAAAAPGEEVRTTALRRNVDIPVWPPQGDTPPAGDAAPADAATPAAQEAQPPSGETEPPEQGQAAAPAPPADAAAADPQWRPAGVTGEGSPAEQAQPAAAADPAAALAPPTTPARPAPEGPQPVPPPPLPQRPTVANPFGSLGQMGPGMDTQPSGTPAPATVAGPFVGFGNPVPGGAADRSPGFSPFQRSFQPPGTEPATRPAGSSERAGMGKKLLVGAMIVAAIGTIGAGAYLAYQGLGDSSSQAAAHGKVPSVVTPPQPDPTPSQAIDSAETDPKEMTPAEAFPAKKVTIAGHTFQRVRVDSTTKCEQGASGKFAEALRDNKCDRLLRATYVDGKRKYAVTTGIAVMPDKVAAVKVDGAKDLANNVWFRGLAGKAGSGAERVDISGGYAAGLVWGRYIVFSYATYSDGHTPKENEKDLGPISDAFRQHTAKVIEKRANGG